MKLARAATIFFPVSALLCVPLAAGFFAYDTANAASDNAGRVEPPSFEIISLKRPGVILTVDSGDLDGDGKTDLLLFHKASRETYDKSCSIYFQRDTGFGNSPALEISLGEGVSAVQVNDIDSDGKSELCAFDSGGMIVFKPLDGSTVESRRVIRQGTLLPRISRRLIVVNWIADLDSDGRSDALLPAAGGLNLFIGGDGGGFERFREYDLPMRASVRGEGGQSYVSYRLPAIEFEDFDGDGNADIGAFDVEQMNFFLTDGSPAPGRRIESPLLREFTKDFIAASKFPDLNSDGIPDAVLVLMSQKKQLQSEARIYFGRKDFSYGNGPDHVYSGDANLILPMFLDATGDGKMEMMLQNIKVGLDFFINYFLRNRIRVDTELRRLNSDGLYSEQPAVRRAIYVRVSESGAEPARNVGDFDGDGLHDLAVGTSEERLSFFLSNKKDFLPRRPTFELNVPAYGTMKTLNLNDDGRTDIIILYPQKDKRGSATLILSK